MLPWLGEKKTLFVSFWRVKKKKDPNSSANHRIWITNHIQLVNPKFET